MRAATGMNGYCSEQHVGRHNGPRASVVLHDRGINGCNGAEGGEVSCERPDCRTSPYLLRGVLGGEATYCTCVPSRRVLCGWVRVVCRWWASVGGRVPPMLKSGVGERRWASATDAKVRTGWRGELRTTRLPNLSIPPPGGSWG